MSGSSSHLRNYLQHRFARREIMNSYHLFFGPDNEAIVIENDPDALDQAPYDRMVRRYSKQPVDAAMADLALKMHGGVAIYSNRTIEVAAI